jgi:hypothetical protein
MRKTWIALGAAVLATGLRLFWLPDMELNDDQVLTARALAGFRFWPPAFLAPAVAEHSGVFHSSGYFYLLSALTGGSGDPLRIAAATALFNSVPIAAGIWLFRRDAALFPAFCLMGVSAPLVMLSRHVWTPDPIAGWVEASILFLALARERRSAGLAAAAAACLWLAPHMYLAALVPAAVVSVLVAGRGGLGRGWIAGCAAGALGFVPLALSFAGGEPGPRKAVLRHGFDQLARMLKDALTLTTPGHVFSRYLAGHLGLLEQQGGRTPALVLTVVAMALATALGVALLGWTLWRATRRWKEAEALERAAPALVAATGAAIFAAGLGTFIHYWIAVVPFVCVAIARAFEKRPRWLWSYVALSAAASASFLWLVHERGGLPGSYGKSFRVVEGGGTIPK